MARSWFASKEVRKQNSVINGHVIKDDTIYFGLLQGFEEEFGDRSLAELESLKPKVWEILRKNILYSGQMGFA